MLASVRVWAWLEEYGTAGGHPSTDVLHVATALHLGVREFWTFDTNQARLALAEKLRVEPLG